MVKHRRALQGVAIAGAIAILGCTSYTHHLQTVPLSVQAIGTNRTLAGPGTGATSQSGNPAQPIGAVSPTVVTHSVAPGSPNVNSGGSSAASTGPSGTPTPTGSAGSAPPASIMSSNAPQGLNAPPMVFTTPPPPGIGGTIEDVGAASGVGGGILDNQGPPATVAGGVGTSF